MSTPKDNNNLPINELKGTKFCDLAGKKKLKIAVLRKFNELQKNSEKQFTKIRKC